MDIEELRTFVEVANGGGVSAGALRLGISKSIVSRRLARIEAELGVQLVARSTRGTSLTEAGATFRNHAARVCVEIDLAKEMMLPTSDLSGRLRIAAPLSLGATHLAAVFAELSRQNPDLHIHTSYSERLVDIISEGFDCAIRLGHLKDSSLIARRVGPLSKKLVASPEYIEAHGAPEAPDELLSHQALMLGTESWQFMDGAKAVTIHPQGRFKADNGEALVAAALSAIGIAALPVGLLQKHLASGALVSIMTRYPLLESGIFVVRPPGKHPSDLLPRNRSTVDVRFPLRLF